jgi:hypothetical protein
MFVAGVLMEGGMVGGMVKLVAHVTLGMLGATACSTTDEETRLLVVVSLEGVMGWLFESVHDMEGAMLPV